MFSDPVYLKILVVNALLVGAAYLFRVEIFNAVANEALKPKKSADQKPLEALKEKLVAPKSPDFVNDLAAAIAKKE